jgi:hypothetical protein
MPKYQVFMPAKNLKTSVFRKSKMTPEEYGSAKQKVSLQREKEIKRCALVSVRSITEAKLCVMPDEKDHKWHADILHWPEDKDARMEAAMDIAKYAKFE